MSSSPLLLLRVLRFLALRSLIPPPTLCAGVRPGLPEHLQHAGQSGGQLLRVEGGGGGSCGCHCSPGVCARGWHLKKTAKDTRRASIW